VIEGKSGSPVLSWKIKSVAPSGQAWVAISHGFGKGVPLIFGCAEVLLWSASIKISAVDVLGELF
jgi:hypothetical protein